MSTECRLIANLLMTMDCSTGYGGKNSRSRLFSLQLILDDIQFQIRVQRDFSGNRIKNLHHRLRMVHFRTNSIVRQGNEIILHFHPKNKNPKSDQLHAAPSPWKVLEFLGKDWIIVDRIAQ